MLKNAYTVEICPRCGERVAWMERPNDPHTFGWVCHTDGPVGHPETISVEPLELEFERLGRRDIKIPLTGE